MFLRTTSRLTRLTIVPRLNPSITTRFNSSHHGTEDHAHADHDSHAHHQFPPPPQGDGNVCTSLLPYSERKTNDKDIMGPTFVSGLKFFGGFFVLYLIELWSARHHDGAGFIHRTIAAIMPPDPDPVLQAARIEEEKHNNMMHMELGQRPIFRSSYPEYSPFF